MRSNRNTGLLFLGGLVATYFFLLSTLAWSGKDIGQIQKESALDISATIDNGGQSIDEILQGAVLLNTPLRTSQFETEPDCDNTPVCSGLISSVTFFISNRQYCRTDLNDQPDLQFTSTDIAFPFHFFF